MPRQTDDAAQANLELMVMSTLARQSGYGYLIQKRIQQASGEQIALRPGTLYRILHKLERKALVQSWWDDGDGPDRRWYKLTAKGVKALNARAARWHTAVDCIRVLLEPDADSRLSP